MDRSRTATALAGLAVSLVASALLWWALDTFVFFLFVPFVPVLLGGDGDDDRTPSARECPACGFRTHADDYEYCPRDGRRLE